MKDKHVLVVEDEFLIGLDLVLALEKAGFGHVEHAATEAEALDLLRTKRWDAVVADANLNGHSIEQVAKLMREKALPFVVVSGYERDNLPKTIGDAPLLSKPVSYVQLLDKVRRLCSEA